MSCICQCWKDMTLKLNCYRCNGVVEYVKCNPIKKEDSKQIILEKLKKDLQEKRTDITILKMEIIELENDILNDRKINDSSDSSDSTIE